MTRSKYAFERTELRALQIMCEGDNELFLNQLADMIGRRDEEIEKLETQIMELETQIMELENERTNSRTSL